MIKLRYIISLVVILLAFTFEFLIHLIWIIGGLVVYTPDLETLSTAQYLYNNPLPTPVELSIPIDDDVVEFSLLRRGEICVGLIIDDRVRNFNYYSRWSRWYLNDSRIPYHMYSFHIYPLLSNEDAPVSTCLHLDPSKLIGLNLFEIEIKLSPFESGISYQWAIKIEPTATPTPKTPPSAP